MLTFILVFVNMYYELENPLLDHSEKSNLICALYGDYHTAAEKTNAGGQQLYPSPAPLNYIQDSVGWAKSTVPVPPATPSGYTYLFGPSSASNNAASYLVRALSSEMNLHSSPFDRPSTSSPYSTLMPAPPFAMQTPNAFISICGGPL